MPNEMQELIEAAKGLWEMWNMTGPDSTQWDELEVSDRSRWLKVIAAARKASDGGWIDPLTVCLYCGGETDHRHTDGRGCCGDCCEMHSGLTVSDPDAYKWVEKIVNARKPSEGRQKAGKCRNCGHGEHGKCMAWAGNGLGWCKCENYEPAPPLSVETPKITPEEGK